MAHNFPSIWITRGPLIHTDACIQRFWLNLGAAKAPVAFELPTWLQHVAMVETPCWGLKHGVGSIGSTWATQWTAKRHLLMSCPLPESSWCPLFSSSQVSLVLILPFQRPQRRDMLEGPWISVLWLVLKRGELTTWLLYHKKKFIFWLQKSVNLLLLLLLLSGNSLPI